MARSLRSSRFIGTASSLAGALLVTFSAAPSAHAQAAPAPARPAPLPAAAPAAPAPAPVAPPPAVSPAPPDLPPPPPPPWTANPNAAPPPAPGVPPPPAAMGPMGPAFPATSGLDSDQERRLGEFELRLKQMEERHRRSHEEQDESWGWVKKLKISGYLQPQGLFQWWNEQGSPNAVGGKLPGGIGSNDTIAKSATELGGGAPGLTTNGDYFRLRRARLKVELEPNEYTRFVMEIDPVLAGGPDNATGTIARNVESQGIAKWGGDVETTFGVGIFKIPYGWEVLQSDADRPFIERSWWERNVTPGEFDTGAKAYTTALDHRLAVQVAVVNGAVQGEKTFALLPDMNRGKDVVGRAAYNFGPIEVGSSGYYGQGTLVSIPNMAFKQYARWAWNAELAFRHRFLEIGKTHLLGEFNFGQNMDRGLNYAGALPSFPTPVANIPGGQVGSHNELGGFIRLEQDITHWTTLALRYDYYSPDYNVDLGNGRHTYAGVGVVHFTKQLQLMVEYNHFVDNVRFTGTSPNKQGDMLSTVFQVRYP